jgi:phospholipid/cholesterol/gamma-HCH transport system substrate-binding protein
MEAEAKYTYVGTAVIVLIAALVLSVVWLRRIGSERDFQLYTIYFERQRLEGLQIGGDVELRGIKVGRVVDYSLAAGRTPDESVNRVQAIVRIDRRAPIRTNTVAVVTRNFVTGIAQITLVTPEPAGPPIGEAPEGEPYPVIAEGTSDLDEIAGKVSRLGDMAARALSDLNHVLSPENREALAATLANLRDLTAALNRSMGRLDRALDSVSRAADEVGRTGDRLASTAERAGAGFDEVVGDARRALQRTERAVDDAAQAIAALERHTQAMTSRVDRSADVFDDQLAAAVAELRISIDAAARALDELQDPRRALLGPDPARLGPGEKLR